MPVVTKRFSWHARVRSGSLLSAVTLLSAAAILLGITLPTAQRHASASTVSSDRTRIALLEQQIQQAGARVQRLVLRFDQVQAHEQALQADLGVMARRLTADRAARAHTARVLRQVAIEAYVSGGSLTTASTLLTTPSSSTDLAAVYASVATSRLHATVTAYQLAQHRTTVTATTLRKEQAAAEATLAKLRPAQHAASVAVAEDEALLPPTQGNLPHLPVLAAAERAAAQRAAERALAARIAAQRAAAITRAPVAAPRAEPSPNVVSVPAPTPSAPSSTPSPPVTSAPTPSAPVSPAGYANPLRAVSGLTPERIDQGVDYSGYGPIYAIGDGVVLSTYNGGWPGGTYIAYRLTNGPASGLVVYAAEDINPSVQIGQSVTPNTVLGTIYAGPDGIETGWANSGAGDTMAMAAGQYGGGNSTAFGANFSQLLTSLGAPGGVLQNNPPTGSLPGGWPSW